jgi:hypothetical protein
MSSTPKVRSFSSLSRRIKHVERAPGEFPCPVIVEFTKELVRVTQTMCFGEFPHPVTIKGIKLDNEQSLGFQLGGCRPRRAGAQAQ